MSKWRVDKEKINVDIPDKTGYVSGGVKYGTKRLVMNYDKKTSNQSLAYEEYVKDLGTESKRENLEIVDQVTPKNETISLDPVPSYNGLNLVRGYQQKSTGNITFIGGDVDGNYGLVVGGYDKPGYEIPHLRYEMSQMYTVKSDGQTFKSSGYVVEDTNTEWFNELLFGKSNNGVYSGTAYAMSSASNGKTNIGWTCYMCYPLVTEQMNAMDTANTSLTPDVKNRVIMKFDKSYDLFSFNLSEKTLHRYVYWHFHTGLKQRQKVYRFTKGSDFSNEKGNYGFDLNHPSYTLKFDTGTSSNANYCDNHLMFIEFSTPITPIYDYEKDCRLPDNATEDEKQKHIRYKQMLRIYWDYNYPNGVILVRSKRRDKDGKVITNNKGEIEWKLGLHAKTEYNYKIKTWNHGSEIVTDNQSTTDPATNTTVKFFNEVIRKNVTEYDIEELDKLSTSFTGFNTGGLFVDNILYAEEIDTDDIDCDIPSYLLNKQDVLKEQTYRTYDEVSTQLWGKEKSFKEYCVDDTTCKLFKNYVQQIVPTTTIVRAAKCETDNEATFAKEYPKGEVVKEKVNYSEVLKETYENKEDEFVNAVFKVYFDNVDGSNVDVKSYTMTSKSDYNKYLDGTIGNNYVTSYPQIDGSDVEYWYMSANKSVVDDGVELPDSYKYGVDYQKVDLYKHSGIHFYPMMEYYDPITLKVTFYSPKTNTEILTKSKTISTLDEYKKFLNGTLTADYVSVPQTLNVDGYTDQPVGFWVLEDNWDKDIRKVKNESMTENDQYGDGDGLQRVNLSNHVMFGDKIELKFYPYIGVNNINHIVVSFQMDSNDLDNATAIYDADTNEKLIGPIGWLTWNAPSDYKSIYQYGYDDTTNSMLKGTGQGSEVTANIFFAHSGDNQGTGYEGVYIYAHKINEELYDTNSINSLSPKSIEEIYPNVKRFKIKMYGEWHRSGRTTLGTTASIKINAYQGGTPYISNRQYLMSPLTLKDGSTETVKEYNYGGDSMAIWSRSGNWDPNNDTKGFIYDEFETIYDFMGYILYDTALQAGEYIEPIIVGKRSGKYAYDETWENYPFYADPDDYEISLTEKVGFIKAYRLDNTVIYVKKKN